MNRKYKFPCGEHYKSMKDKGRFWSKEELAEMYDSRCGECRDSYKNAGNYPLFRLKWWHRTVKFNAWIFGVGHYQIIKHAWWTYKNKGLWKTIKLLFWSRYNYDQYQTLNIPFISVYWHPLDMDDIREGWIDMNRYLPTDPLPEPKWEECNRETEHLIKVALRYQRMFEAELKLKNDREIDE